MGNEYVAFCVMAGKIIKNDSNVFFKKHCTGIKVIKEKQKPDIKYLYSNVGSFSNYTRKFLQNDIHYRH